MDAGGGEHEATMDSKMRMILIPMLVGALVAGGCSKKESAAPRATTTTQPGVTTTTTP
ncbi:MAG: hypothetical protein QOI20_1458, partial [Acidimicrobiaceae bacterium]|nr:hypothetical protein [Acidimicrobiaceae bacterium]